MIDPQDPLIELKITSATCSFLALGTSVYRIFKRRDRFWADDAWVLFASLALVAQIVAVFLHVPIPNNLSQTTRVAVYYLMAMTFYVVIWASRLSILFSIMRIESSQVRKRRLAWVAYAFVLAVLFFIAQLLWSCEPEPSWKNAPNPQCKLTIEVAVCQLVTDVIADAILLFAPFPLFNSLADKSLRWKLTLIFSTCVVTTIVSLVHAVLILRNGGVKVVIAALVEDALSLLVANIPVVITTLFNVFNDNDADTSYIFSSSWFSGPRTTQRTGLMLTLGSRVAASDVDTSVSSVAWNTDSSEGTALRTFSSSKSPHTPTSSNTLLS
ncbi:hypothetical protein FB45DRAFT_945298 [Roridomyces roridus]|uniref:Rhodopsin domain-containing protein n=1 Tax=Roridomyces roridus TaxID=1738132 RepID=A0AAD7F8N1_9AGAR|nr:hypothetical protein FB45DRAFT_945298 [Roridomyces roridus]